MRRLHRLQAADRKPKTENRKVQIAEKCTAKTGSSCWVVFWSCVRCRLSLGPLSHPVLSCRPVLFCFPYSVSRSPLSVSAVCSPFPCPLFAIRCPLSTDPLVRFDFVVCGSWFVVPAARLSRIVQSPLVDGRRRWTFFALCCVRE